MEEFPTIEDPCVINKPQVIRIKSNLTFSDALWKHHNAEAMSFFTQSPVKYTTPRRSRAPGCNYNIRSSSKILGDIMKAPYTTDF